MSIAGKLIDWTEKVERSLSDPESYPAGAASPHYAVSEAVTTSQQDGLYVYHLPDDHLGQGASFGNSSVWAETKGNGDLLSLFSVAAGRQVLGGMSVNYMLPFSDLSVAGRGRSRQSGKYAPAISFARGQIHLHPAYEQREFIIGDGLHVLKTFYLPRWGEDDPPAAYMSVALMNRTRHPIRIAIAASVDLGGRTDRDLVARYDPKVGALLAWSRNRPREVRFFGADRAPRRYWATVDEEEAYAPREDLPNQVSETGSLIGALQFNFLLLPDQHRKVRLMAGCSEKGEDAALAWFRRSRASGDALKRTIASYRGSLQGSELRLPSDILSQGVQWAKANMLRTIARYPVGKTFTNDPGKGSHIVGRDTAWFCYGCDFLQPEACCEMLGILASRQRGDGLIPEFVDGLDGSAEYHQLNINDNTPLFALAVCHHLSVTGHRKCVQKLYEPAQRAVELILRCRDEHGIVRCTASGIGAQGVCSWRNVLQHEQITGEVTELNAECYGALGSMAFAAQMLDRSEDAQRYREAAEHLREAVNRRLVDSRTDLYLRNIDLEGRVYSQATVDMVFTLLFGLADQQSKEAVISRLLAPDFMSAGGLRVLPFNNPRWDPSGQSGCLGGVWPGVTWWFAMGCRDIHPKTMADTLQRSYEYLLRDPQTYNTVPGQFNEWSDGQTLVNRGMRLSPWAPPRFLWAAIEGMAGVKLTAEGVRVHPQLPNHWLWLQLQNLRCGQRRISFFIVRQHDGLHLYTSGELASELPIHRYAEELPDNVEPLTTGMTATMMRKSDEIILFFASSRDRLLVGPLLVHGGLKGHGRYHVWRLSSMESDWHDLGSLPGRSLGRLAVQVEPQGYTLYRFQMA